MIDPLHLETNHMIKTQDNRKPTTKPKFKQKSLIREESEFAENCKSELFEHINNNPHKKPQFLLTDIFNQLIDCLLQHEEIVKSFSSQNNEQYREILQNLEKNITKKYLLINIIKRINFKLDEKYDHALASKNTREKIRNLLAHKFPNNPEATKHYNDKFKEILRSKCML